MGWWKTADKGDLIVAVQDANGVCPVRNVPLSLKKGDVHRVIGITEDHKGVLLVAIEGHSQLTIHGRHTGWPVEFFRPVKPLHTSLTDCLHAPTSPWGVPTQERV